jgi:4-amino-4-deoxy-L-arabinose transferase-like glycosyltransferase
VIGCEVIGLYALVTLPMLLRYPPIWPDEVLFMSPADSLARGHGMSTAVLAGFISGMDRYTFWLSPGYFVALAALFRFSDPAHELLVMRLFSWMLGVVLLGLAWMILRRLTSHSLMIWPGLILLATHPTFIRAANLGRMEMLTLVFAAGAAGVYLRFLEKGQSRTAAAAGLLAGLACLCHPAGIVILVALALHQLLKGGLRTLARKEIYLFLASALVPLLPWLVYILQAPQFFLIQFAGQFVRKTSAAHTFLEHGTAARLVLPPLAVRRMGTTGGFTPGRFAVGVYFFGKPVPSGASGSRKSGSLGAWPLGVARASC